MDLYTSQRLSQIKIEDFREQAEHQRLVSAARGEEARKPRHLSMMALIGLMVLVSRIGGSSLS